MGNFLDKPTIYSIKYELSSTLYVEFFQTFSRNFRSTQRLSKCLSHLFSLGNTSWTYGSSKLSMKGDNMPCTRLRKHFTDSQRLRLESSIWWFSGENKNVFLTWKHLNYMLLINSFFIISVNCIHNS